MQKNDWTNFVKECNHSYRIIVIGLIHAIFVKPSDT